MPIDASTPHAPLRTPPVPPPAPPGPPAWRTPMVWVQFLGGAVGGGAAMMLAVAVVREAGGEIGLAGLVGALIGLAIGWWPQMLLHEAGHALAGRLAGFELVALAVGRWRGEHGGDGWRFERRPQEPGVGGFALMLPREERTSRAAHAVYILGGPMANLAATAALVALAWPASAAFGGWAAGLVLGVAMAGAILGLVNLVPFSAGGFSTDGRQLLALARGREEARLTAELMRVSGWARLGHRPRDWPALDLTGADDPTLPKPIADALLRLAIARAMDGPEAGLPAVQPQIDRLAATLREGPAGLRAISALTVASWAIKACHDPDGAEAWLAETEGSLLDLAPHRDWLRAAIDLARGDHPAARAGLALARERLPRVRDAASRLMLAEELDALDARLATPAAA